MNKGGGNWDIIRGINNRKLFLVNEIIIVGENKIVIFFLVIYNENYIFD